MTKVTESPADKLARLKDLATPDDGRMVQLSYLDREAIAWALTEFGARDYTETLLKLSSIKVELEKERSVLKKQASAEIRLATHHLGKAVINIAEAATCIRSAA